MCALLVALPSGLSLWENSWERCYSNWPGILGCFQRMKNSRARLLDKYRRVGVAPRGLMAQEVMEAEWLTLQSTHESLAQRCSRTFAQVEDPEELAVLEDIQQELMSQEQAFIEEYERSLWFDDRCLWALLEGLQTDGLICPVCSRYNLTVVRGTVLCQCGLRLSSQAPELTEQIFRALLEESVNRHSEFCAHRPEFSVTSGTEENASLLLSCVVCDTWMVLL
ncbi:RPA-interacting protein isoform X2 [Phascolarctos cinereus]|uniref:RPA-interacting protein isoform X2 n=1 Tax=Phascolarctos cinereus TaxID=38626 RepID=A0A6P5INZ5_PHACI|nr:RPA-interacting protein isoform X2 [Phascolarctos cinereus]